MADRYLGSNQQFMGSFSVLEGVMVKISDKFQVPEKVVLPIDLSLIKLSATSVKFDFSLEEQVIQKANEERDQQIAEVSKETEEVNSNETEGGCTEAAKNEEEMNNQDDKEDANSSESIIMSLADTPILEPMQINSKPVMESGNKTIQKQFNLSEFEDSNVTPFELVELQTLDDIDELKSVLQPESIKTKNKKISSEKSVKSAEQELDFSIFNISSQETEKKSMDRQKEVATASLLQDFESSSSSFDAYSNSATMPTYSNVNNFPNSLHSTYIAPSSTVTQIAPGFRTGSFYEPIFSPNNIRHIDYAPPKTAEATSQNSNLTKTNSKSLPNLADNTLFTSNQGRPGQQSNCQETGIPTSRISNIMKQYQFTRFTNSESRTEQKSPIQADEGRKFDFNNGTSELRPVSRHGLLPPLTNLPKVDAFNATSNNKVNFDTGNALPGSQSPPQLSPQKPISPSLVKESQLPVSQSVSWLQDPTNSLTADERKLINNMVGMGFPSHRSARAVQRFKDNEKEIIDFLVQTQQIEDEGFNGDDVEIALENSKYDTEKAVSYLELVNKWKELGFPPQKIHDALKNTDRENENVFEYLTR